MKVQDTAVRNVSYHCLEYDHEQTGDLFLVACGMEDCDPGVKYGPDVRDCYHLHVVRSGTGVLRAGGKEMRTGRGGMFLLKHGETAEYTADRKEPWSYCWVTFNGTDAAGILRMIGFSEGVYTVGTTADPEAFFSLIRRMHERPEMTYVNDLRRRGILMEFLALARETSDRAEDPDARMQRKPTEEYIRRAVDFIHYNYSTIRVSDVIRFIGFSRSYFSSAFRESVGMSLRDYILFVRMKKAKQLLEETELRIQEVAAAAGYEDQLHFSKVFRQNTGMSPTEYRNAADRNRNR